MLKTTSEQAALDAPVASIVIDAAVCNPCTSETFTSVEPSGDTYVYRIDAYAQAHVVRCSAALSKLVVPELLGGCTVVGFDEGSFANLMQVEHVICPSGLQDIADRAFEGCLHLTSVALNDGLRSLGREVFSLCIELRELAVPESVESVGARLTGSNNNMWSSSAARVLVSPRSKYLFFDASGVLYRRSRQGNVLVDASGFKGSELNIEAGTVEIGPHALSQLANLTSVVMPEGLKRIGESAFRGCSKLRSVLLPASLERIDAGAFACTKVARIAIPAKCCTIDTLALNTSAALLETVGTAYSSTIEHITVHPDNPAYCMVGPVMCAVTPAGLTAVLCEANADEVDLRSVAYVGPGAFAGTSAIGHMVLPSNIRFDDRSALLAHGRCKTLTLICPAEGKDEVRIDLEIPSGRAGASLLTSGLCGGSVDVGRFLELYDEAVAQEADELAKAREMVARLAAPHMLDAERARVFTESVSAVLDSICIQFGARAYFEGFEQLMDCGILNESNISAAIALLSGFGDAPSSGYLLESKRRRYGNAAFDYEL